MIMISTLLLVALFCNHFCIINIPSSDKLSPAMEHVVNTTSDQHTSKKVPFGRQVMIINLSCA